MNVFLTFLKLGFVAFGGPLAHIALFEDHFVRQEKWLTHNEFLEYIGLTHLIPGPNSTEMALFIGFHRNKFKGLFLAGLGFILPSVILTTIIGLIYQSTAQFEQIQTTLVFLQGVVLAIILQALYKLGSKAEKSLNNLLIMIISIPLVYFGFGIISTVLFCGLLYVVFDAKKIVMHSIFPFAVFKTFFYIGSVLVGSGYVLIAYIQDLIVTHHGWITQSQLLDAIAIGQLTPGPVLSTAAIVGLLSFGLPGAIAASVGIFMPSFLLTMVVARFHYKLKSQKFISLFLKGATVASLSAMIVVTFQLLKNLNHPLQWVILVLSLLGFIRFKMTSYIVVIFGFIVSLFLSFI